ncbi:hypothetical protein [Salinibacterium sp. ZJ450]|uniref:hypothetical protein n=1 Tax=Salinibacterium sp. ZJ450 TaxID=2708338 RepID=UPI001749D71F|nr:hypothetical protein [Salinibacterium sp. ZJ450]
MAQSLRKRILAASALSTRLSEWNRGDKATAWFKDNVSTPADPSAYERSIRRYERARLAEDLSFIAIIVVAARWVVGGQIRPTRAS